jgi:hypothetical protein
MKISLVNYAPHTHSALAAKSILFRSHNLEGKIDSLVKFSFGIHQETSVTLFINRCGHYKSAIKCASGLIVFIHGTFFISAGYGGYRI